MTSPASKRYFLEYTGHLIEVETAEVGLGHIAKLFVDGQQVDEQKAVSERARLRAGDITVFVQWLWTGQVAKCVLVEEQGNKPPEALEEIPLTPPRGSYAARQAELERKHPTLYASRHVIFAVLKALIPLLGLGLIITSLLPNLDLLGFLRELFGSRPESPPPDNWVRFIVKPIVKSAKWVLWTLPILAAIFITLEEIKRQQKKLQKPEKIVSPGNSNNHE